MKIAPRAIREFLQQPDKGCAGVLIYGPDAGLVHERMQAIAAKILPAGDTFGRMELTEDQVKNDPALLADELAAFSLMGGRRVVVVRDAGDKIAKAMEAALAAADGSNYLVLCAGELGPRSTLRALFESAKQFAALPCYRDEAMDVQALIRRRFDETGIMCGREAMAYLTEHLGNDRGVTMSELDKIILYLGGERTLSLQSAEALVGHNRDITLDAICMDIASGNAAAMESQLTQSFREGVQPIALLRALQRHFQRLYMLRGLMREGKSAADAVASLRPPVFFRHVPTLAGQADAWPEARLMRALERLVKAELACKQMPVDPVLLAYRACAEIVKLPSGVAAKAA